MKVVSSINRRRGDDGEYPRLLATFQDQIPYKIYHLEAIRGTVYKIETSVGEFILKGYTSYSRLKLQEAFTSSLKKEGFNQTYSFVRISEDPLLYNDMYYGCLQYLEPSTVPFSYSKDKERSEGLELLTQYHNVSKSSVHRYQTLVPNFNLKRKWEERTAHFLNNFQYISDFIPKSILYEWMKWANWSLEGIEKHYPLILSEEAVILHGDVAHHNFLRKTNGKLYLIDFDLISIGPRNMDLLQYANRILPHINWDINKLSKYPILSSLLTNPVYVYGLAYPTDIFREWNRIIKESGTKQNNNWKLKQIVNLSLNKLSLRQNFIKELEKLL